MKKILLIKKGALGDVLMTTPLVRQLKQSHQCRVDYVTSKSSATILKNNQYIDKLHQLDDSTFQLKNIMKLASFYLRLRSQYDYVFVLDKHWYFALMAKLIGGITVGFYRDELSKYILNRIVIYNNVERYQGDYYLDLLNVSGVTQANYGDIQLNLTVTDGNQNNVDNILKQNNIGEYAVVINSGGNNAFEKTGIRMLPQDKFIYLVSELLKQYKTVILSGSQVDDSNNQQLMQDLNNPSNLYNFAGKLSFSETGALFKKSEHVYVTDCGALHLAIIAAPDKFRAYFGVTNPHHIVPEYLMKNTIWYDKNIYNENYQLYGVLRKDEPRYFSELLFPRDL